jgi:hypothetical protein
MECARCLKIKDLENFRQIRDSNGKRYSTCKQCFMGEWKVQAKVFWADKHNRKCRTCLVSKPLKTDYTYSPDGIPYPHCKACHSYATPSQFSDFRLPVTDEIPPETVVPFTDCVDKLLTTAPPALPAVPMASDLGSYVQNLSAGGKTAPIKIVRFHPYDRPTDDAEQL